MTPIVIDDVAATVGVPERRPPEVRVRPVGSVPAIRVHVFAPNPPLEVNWKE